jgi:hypothetical protein
MSACEAARGVEEPQLGGLTGLELQHDLYLAIADVTIWSAVTDLVERAGAQLQSLQLQRQGDGFTARCRLKQLSADSARSLAGALLDSGLARQASVEHLMLARAGAERAP